MAGKTFETSNSISLRCLQSLLGSGTYLAGLLIPLWVGEDERKQKLAKAERGPLYFCRFGNESEQSGDRRRIAAFETHGGNDD